MRFFRICVFLFALFFVVSPAASFASSGSSITGPGSVHAGDTIVLTFSVTGSGLLGVNGQLTYDASKLTYVSSAKKIGGNWTVSYNNSAGAISFIAQDVTQTSTINGTAALFSVTFRVSSSLTAGTQVTVNAGSIEASAGTGLISVPGSSYTKTVAPPLSQNSFLASLSCGSTALTPAFNKNTLDYSVSVPYNISKLTISTAPEDSKARVSVNNPELTPGGMTAVTVTVTAENGSTRIYKIRVTRERDPNYVASSNANLSSICVEGFLLSPVFSPDKKEYIVWLPYEVGSVSVSAQAEDEKADVMSITGAESLAPGDNRVSVICRAENGETQEYCVIVKRAFDAAAATNTTPETAVPPETTIPPETVTTVLQETTAASDKAVISAVSDKSGGGQAPLWLMAVVSAVCLGCGAVIGFFFKDKVSKHT